MTPITYPARPLNGGPLDKALPKRGQWAYEPKYNGWRALVHVPTGTMFNRHGAALSIADSFADALLLLCSTMDAQAFKWVDVEALEQRHAIGRGCLIVLDVVPEPASAQTPYTERRGWLEAVWPGLDLTPQKFPIVSIAPEVYGSQTTWSDLQRINERLGCEFYEGLVAKREDSIYPIQLQSSSREFPYWVKHRWSW